MKKKLLSCVLAFSCVLSLASPAFASDELKPTSSNWPNDFGNTYGGNWSDGTPSHLRKVDGGYLRFENMYNDAMHTLDADKYILLEYYNEDFKVTDIRSIPIELDGYIAFYEGKNHYYILFSQGNGKEDNNREVARVVQYDKDWNRLKATSICGANTVNMLGIPTADMAEVDGKLLIHTNHTMYKSSRDGINHQANLSFVIDIDSMTLLQQAYTVSFNPGYVSHSFNQLVDVASDGGVYTADHGDAIPRAMAIHSWPESSIVARPDMSFEEMLELGWPDVEIPETPKPTLARTLTFAGASGDNYTGAALSGFEVSSTHAIMTGTSRPQDGSYCGTYNVFLTATDRKNFGNDGTKFTWITSYDDNDNGLSCSNPYLLEIAEDEFFLIWTEYTRITSDHTLCWTTLDNKGTQIGEIHRTTGDLSQVPPILNDDGDLVWYTTKFSAPMFYILNPTTNQLTKTLATTDRGAFQNEPSSWAKAEIAAAEAADLITKSNRDNFQANITRAQFAELVVNLLETIMFQPLRIDENIYFSDTTDAAVLKAASAGVVNGVGNNQFKPNAPITREEIATMLNRALVYNYDNGGSDLAPLAGSLAGYTDAGQISSWAKAGVGRLAANGIMKGTSNTRISPKENASVEACILLIYRLYDTCMEINKIPLEIPTA